MSALSQTGSFLLHNAGILISALSAIFAMAHDRWQIRWWRTLSITGIVGGMVWALVGAQADANQQRRDMEDTIKRVDDWVSQESKSVKDSVELLRTDMRNLGVLPEKVQAATTSQITTIVNAAAKANSLVAAQDPSRRAQLKIWVFNHFKQDVNFAVVQQRLQALASDVEVEQKKIDEPTNSVWYGQGVRLEEAKAAALIATSAGVAIRQICPAQKVPIPTLIQIGGSRLVRDQPALSASDIGAWTPDRCGSHSAVPTDVPTP